MKYTLEEHNAMVAEILEVVQSPNQVQFVMSLQYEIAHKQVYEAQQEATRLRHQLDAMEKALRIVVNESSRY